MSRCTKKLESISVVGARTLRAGMEPAVRRVSRLSWQRSGTALAALLLWVAPLAGCFQAETVVSVAADGSGEIAVTSLLSSEMVEMTRAFADMGEETEGDAETAAPASEPELFPEADLRAKAAEMGEGVTFVRSEPVERDGMEGVRAIYAFTDVSKLKLSLNDGAKSMESAGMEAEGLGANEEPPLAFRLEKGKGGNSRLVIHVPPDPKEADGDGGSSDEAADEPMPEPSDDEIKMIQAMFEGMRFAFIVEPMGTLKETNSPFARGNQVPIFELAFDKLFADIDKLKALASHGEPESFAELSGLLEGIEGIAVPLEEEIVLEFEPAK